MSAFRRDPDPLALTQAAVSPEGLREAQVGALLALGAHALRSDDPAQLILPTGVGKTAIAVLAPYVLRAHRVLVVVPGALIRGQVASAFEDLSRPKRAGVLTEETDAPRVAVASRRATADDWKAWRQADVVVGTPHSLSPEITGVARVPRDLFDVVVFDEAHHLPATTWDALLTAVDARAVLLTATPFRRDHKPLPGEFAFTYPLARALEKGVFGEVAYRPVDEIEGESPDLTLARAAVSRLRAEDHVAADSRLLVRTDSVAEAKRLARVYEELGAPLGVIVHTTSWTTATKMLAAVDAGSLSGFACVGSLTEGFDFPALKIGAYHAPHKTLGPTLQFVGRLSRVGEIGGELFALRRDVSAETAELYREDVAWRALLPEIVDSAVDDERHARAFVARAASTGPLDVPPLAITPPRSVHIYRTAQAPNLTVDIERVGGARVVERISHPESSTLALLTRRLVRPRFLRQDLLDHPTYELHLLTYVDDPGVLFVSTATMPGLDDLLAAFSSGARRQLTGAELRRLLSAARLERFFSVGTRAARGQAVNTSYRTTAGQRTDDDITPAEGRGWDLGHGMGRSGTGTFGFSVAKSKIWQPGAAANLYAFRLWCENQARIIADESATVRPSKLDLLGMSEPLTAYPDDPITALWPVELLLEGAALLIDGEVLAPERVELWPTAESTSSEIQIEARLEGTVRAQLSVGLDGRIAVSGGDLRVSSPDDEAAVSLEEYLAAEPLTIFFARGERAMGARLAPPPPTIVAVAAEVRRPRAWEDVAITIEFGPPPAGSSNVATAAYELLAADVPIVVQDHLAGEIADFVGIDISRLVPEIHLVHCKASATPTPAARLGDVQELVAQALRSVQWLSTDQTLYAELRRRLDERAATQVRQGDEEELKELLDGWSGSPPPARWHIWAVQPGISDARLDDAAEVSSLLTALHSWCASQEAELRLVCSY